MKKLVSIFLIVAFLSYLACYIRLMNVPVSSVIKTNLPQKGFYEDNEAALLNFIERYMLGKDGRILTNLSFTGEGMATLSER